MRKTTILLLAAMAIQGYGCSSSQKIEKAPMGVVDNAPASSEEPMMEQTWPEINVAGDSTDLNELPRYNASRKREQDLIHEKVEISFDWEKQHALGKATLTLKPYFYPSDKLTLDAKGFDINSITLEGSATPLKYEYKDKEQLIIQLGKTFTRKDEYKIVISYVAKPNERTTGGSEAITSDKGLFFINPKGEDPEKPRQIWTQGETQSNSCWMPTIDSPNERCTQEMYITVDNKYKTLSNGLMLSSTKNTDGTRTDYWKMDKAHPPYLFMMAIGEFAIVKDKWNGIDVDYYVEPAYEKSARAIFPNTPELLQFYSDKLGVKYPWQKYSQVVVRDYVSGAMENTTAVIFGEFMQHDARELIDEEVNEDVVAHEMFHHWFGDYVTCESWSNLTLNEGFANYSEYLWKEHKHGVDAADAHRASDFVGYIGQASSVRHDLIDYTYADRESMFDAHSYNKGGLVLHMLRNYVGDDAFFMALNRYLTTNAMSSVEASQLRVAFESVTGEDLNWFWDQWFYASGHPSLNLEKSYNPTTKELTLTIEQTQDPMNNLPIYQLPVKVDIYTKDGQKPMQEQVFINQRKQTFTFKVDQNPILVDFDADKSVLAEVKYDKTEEELIAQYNNAPKYENRSEAIEGLANSKTEAAKMIFRKALNDNYWGIRSNALMVDNKTEPMIMNTVAKLAETDSHSAVRALAVMQLGETKEARYLEVCQKIMDKEQSYTVISSALKAMNTIDHNATLTYIKKFENDENENIIGALADIYVQSPQASQLSFFEKNIKKINGQSAIGFMSSYALLLTKVDEVQMQVGADELTRIGLTDLSLWRRYGATKGLVNMREAFADAKNKAMVLKLTKLINDIKAKETSNELKTIYSNF
jgi:aminopeptidase N